LVATDVYETSHTHLRGITEILELGKSHPGKGRRNAVSSFRDLDTLSQVPKELLTQLDDRGQITYLDLLSKDLNEILDVVRTQMQSLIALRDYNLQFRPVSGTVEAVKEAVSLKFLQFDKVKTQASKVSKLLAKHQEAYSTYSYGKAREVDFFDYTTEFYKLDTQKQRNSTTLSNSPSYNQDLDSKLEKLGIEPEKPPKSSIKDKSRNRRIKTVKKPP
jgi:uncharacterized protein YlaN (UPF0358 family)